MTSLQLVHITIIVLPAVVKGCYVSVNRYSCNGRWNAIHWPSFLYMLNPACIIMMPYTFICMEVTCYI